MDQDLCVVCHTYKAVYGDRCVGCSAADGVKFTPPAKLGRKSLIATEDGSVKYEDLTPVVIDPPTPEPSTTS